MPSSLPLSELWAFDQKIHWTVSHSTTKQTSDYPGRLKHSYNLLNDSRATFYSSRLSLWLLCIDLTILAVIPTLCLRLWKPWKLQFTLLYLSRQLPRPSPVLNHSDQTNIKRCLISTHTGLISLCRSLALQGHKSVLIINAVHHVHFRF